MKSFLSVCTTEGKRKVETEEVGPDEVTGDCDKNRPPQSSETRRPKSQGRKKQHVTESRFTRQLVKEKEEPPKRSSEGTRVHEKRKEKSECLDEKGK